MADTVTNTNASLKDIPGHLKQEIEKSLERAKKAFSEEKQVEVSISKNMAPFIGLTLPIGINGVKVVLPVDGTKHKIPESFAKHLQDYLAQVRI